MRLKTNFYKDYMTLKTKTIKPAVEKKRKSGKRDSVVAEEPVAENSVEPLIEDTFGLSEVAEEPVVEQVVEEPVVEEPVKSEIPLVKSEIPLVKSEIPLVKSKKPRKKASNEEKPLINELGEYLNPETNRYVKPGTQLFKRLLKEGVIVVDDVIQEMVKMIDEEECIDKNS